MKKQNILWQSVCVLAGIALLPTITQAQDIHDRRVDQHDRIRQGVSSGELTHREARSIRHRETNIRSRAARDRAAHGGRLTRAERARLNRSLNRTSHTIYRDKHNGAVR